MMSSHLVNDNFYAFSFNKTLLDMSMHELPQPMRLKYMQVDSMNKCVPQDWFLGYDQFAIYSFLNLVGKAGNRGSLRESASGFLKTYFRPEW